MSPVLRTLIFTVVVPAFWTVWLPYWWVVRRGARPDLSLASVPGWLLIVAGAGLYLVCAFWGFAFRGKGTPAPIDPPKKLVVEGPYRVVRNPMYESVLLVLVGEAIVLHSVPLAELAAVFFVGATLFVMLYEEPTLQRKFGAEYDAYRRRVPRWLPKISSRSSSRH